VTLDDVLEELAATRARLHGLQRRRAVASDARAPAAYAWLLAGRPLQAVQGLGMRDLDHAIAVARRWATENGAAWPPGVVT
jgi:hypothetical protein